MNSECVVHHGVSAKPHAAEIHENSLGTDPATIAGQRAVRQCGLY